jgi:peroxiredoxin Q/BCP
MAAKAKKKTPKKAAKKSVKPIAKKKAAKKTTQKSTAKSLKVPAAKSLLGKAAPDFTMTTDSGKTIALKDLRGKRVVLYFYPKDDTPGCTVQACAFRDGLPKFSTAKAVVIGVSKDNVASHQKFKAKFKLNFPLASDDAKVSEAYGVWKEKNMYGRKYMGIERSTFIIDESGVVRAEWRKVSVPGHADEVTKALGILI